MIGIGWVNLLYTDPWPWIWRRWRGLDWLRGLFPVELPAAAGGDPQLAEPPALLVRKTVRATQPPAKRSLNGGRRK